MPVRFVAKVVLTSALFVPLTFAQTAVPPEKGIPKFTSRSELVMVPTVVTDKAGNHVTGLTKDDFTLLQDGHPEPIAIFEEVHTSDKLISPVQSEPGVFSNSIPNDGINRRVVIVVFDMLNTPFASRAEARAALIRNLPKLIDPSMPIAFITLEGDGLHQIHSLTSDPRALAAALDQVNRTNGGTLSRYQLPGSTPGVSISPMPGDVTRDVTALNGVFSGIYDAAVSQVQIGPPTGGDRLGSDFGHSGADADSIFASYQAHQLVDITLFGLEQIARAYSGIPGRKIMVWVTGGLPMAIEDPLSISATGDFAHLGELMIDDYRRTWRALNQSGISVYPVDAVGLIPGEELTVRNNFASTFRGFADATGGVAFYNHNDIVGGVLRATEDAKQYYEIGYYLPKESHGKPQWSKLKVKVNRKNVEVHARDGFLSGYSEKPNPGDLKREMDLAFASPVDYTGFPLTLKVDPPTPDGHVKVKLDVPARAFKIDRDNNNYANLEFAAVAMGPKRFSKGLLSQRIVGNLKPENADKIEKDGLNWSTDIALPPQANRLKFVVRDNLTGKIGSVVAYVSNGPTS